MSNSLIRQEVRASLLVQLVKNPPAMQETSYNAGDLALILGSGRSLEKEMVTHSSILTWEIPMDRVAWQSTVHGFTRVR